MSGPTTCARVKLTRAYKHNSTYLPDTANESGGGGGTHRTYCLAGAPPQTDAVKKCHPRANPPPLEKS